ncbi:MAG: hypothetical protein KatS3mg087_0338 [Patescibacteria group bacterium]|nr:MAG: hypothetical protein KatS3mg087_0338 [Patescibacteria group bacterium]
MLCVGESDTSDIVVAEMRKGLEDCELPFLGKVFENVW